MAYRTFSAWLTLWFFFKSDILKQTYLSILGLICLYLDIDYYVSFIYLFITFSMHYVSIAFYAIYYVI